MGAAANELLVMKVFKDLVKVELGTMSFIFLDFFLVKFHATLRAMLRRASMSKRSLKKSSTECTVLNSRLSLSSSSASPF